MIEATISHVSVRVCVCERESRDDELSAECEQAVSHCVRGFIPCIYSVYVGQCCGPQPSEQQLSRSHLDPNTAALFVVCATQPHKVLLLCI